tara:strand:+ start:1184 stop:2266 length:1083 start_codon:yes stop_codon:yes gene_type:complete
MILEKNLKNISKIHGIEILRFISALAILIWHYRHFSYPLVTPLSLEIQPFFNFLKIFYTRGYLGVNFFWCISGFIFFWKYGNMIKDIKFKIFFKSRFSRLYPLCFLTLIIITILQKIYFNYAESYYVYQINDSFHFILHLLLASNWGFDKGLSFNGPIWSISTEIIIYGIFFIALKTFKNSFLLNISIILVCLTFKIFYEDQASVIIDCTLFFFIGGSVNFISNYLKNISKIKLKFFLLAIIILSIYIIIDRNINNINNFTYLFQLFFYPIIIYLFCDISIVNKKISNFFSLLGNLTFSSYLLHFPIQILIKLFYLNIDKEIPVLNSYFFIFYLSIVLIISYFSYNYFEYPMKNYIRKKL